MRKTNPSDLSKDIYKDHVWCADTKNAFSLFVSIKSDESFITD